MPRIVPFVVLGFVFVVGCDTKKAESTAPSKNPEKPGVARKLTVKSPGSQTVTQDKTDELTVSIDRDNFSAPVTIELKNLPKGVTVETKDLTLPADKNSLTVTVKAAPDAPAIVDHPVTVTAKAKDQTDLPDATTDFKLTVKTK